MKMTLATYDLLSDAVRPLMFGRAKLCLESERARWDALHASRFDTRILYSQDLDDSHIDTALRAIAKRS